METLIVRLSQITVSSTSWTDSEGRTYKPLYRSPTINVEDGVSTEKLKSEIKDVSEHVCGARKAFKSVQDAIVVLQSSISSFPLAQDLRISIWRQAIGSRSNGVGQALKRH